MFEALLDLQRAVCEANGHSQSIMEEKKSLWWALTCGDGEGC